MGFLVEFLCENIPIIKIFNVLSKKIFVIETFEEVSINIVGHTEHTSQTERWVQTFAVQPGDYVIFIRFLFKPQYPHLSSGVKVSRCEN